MNNATNIARMPKIDELDAEIRELTNRTQSALSAPTIQPPEKKRLANDVIADVEKAFSGVHEHVTKTLADLKEKIASLEAALDNERSRLSAQVATYIHLNEDTRDASRTIDGALEKLSKGIIPS